MKKNNKTCIVCGKKYTFCNRCGEFDHMPRWMAIYHDENCKNIYTVVGDFLAGISTKIEAKKELKKCDLSNKNSFHKVILNAINDICVEPKAEKIVESTETKDIAKTTMVVENAKPVDKKEIASIEENPVEDIKYKKSKKEII